MIGESQLSNAVFLFWCVAAQPPGVPEICKKSLTTCPVSGGKELFILGKNFLKDTQVVFQTDDWKQSVNPDKEFLQQVSLKFELMYSHGRATVANAH